MYDNWKFPQTPDSFTRKVQQVVRENMKETVSAADDEERNQKEEIKLKKLEDVEKNVVQDGSRGRRMYGWQKKAVAAALALAVVGAGGFTVHAVASSLVKARMENLSREEKTELLDEVDSRVVEASSFSRELTQGEKERERELRIAYQQEGRFPEGELVRVEDESEVDKDMLCFDAKTFCFYLPERTLTDEELLQMIDYQNKTNYALGERYEESYADEIAAQKAETEEIKQKVEADGGITEAEAVAKAQEWLDKLYGKTTEGMEVLCDIDTEGLGTKELPVYNIQFSLAGVDTYNFAIAADGGLGEVCYIGKEILADEMSAADGEAKAEALSQKAEKYLRDKFGVSEESKEVYYSYNTDENNTILSNMIGFRFIMEDNMTYVVTLDCVSGVLELYKVQDYEAYQKDLEAAKEIEEKGIMSYDVVRNQLK